jgi:transketolase
MDAKKLQELKSIARDIRILTIDMIAHLGVGHIGGALSMVDVLVALYFNSANVNPQFPCDPGRDRVIVSKGHGGPGLYATLAKKGYFPEELLHTLNLSRTNLPSHCDMHHTVGVDMTTGSLGQGFSCAVGMAIGAKLDNNPCKIYAIIGDGESQEGQIWEAAMLAGSRKLDNLIVFCDNNRMQIDGYVEDVNGIEPLADKWRAFNFDVVQIDGHDFEQIIAAIEAAKARQGKPSMIILNTIKGKGAYFAEGLVSSHNMNVTKEMSEKAIAQLLEEKV